MSSNMRIPLPNRFTVVSNPAANTSPAIACSSFWLRCVSAEPLSASLDQLTHQIVTGSAPQLPQVVGEPDVESGDPFLHAAVLPPRQSDVQARRGQLTELQDAAPVPLGHTQDVADDRDRKLRAVPSDDVDRRRTGRPADPRGGRGLLDPITQRGDRPGGEHRRHRLAVAGVIRRLDGQQRRCAQRMKKIVARAASPASAVGAGRFDPVHHHPEVVGSQQLVGERMVDGQVADAALHQRAQRPQFVVERHRVGGHRRIGDQPGRQFTPPDPDLRGAPDKPVHRKPVQSLLHSSSIDQPAAARPPPSLGASALGGDLEVRGHDLVGIAVVDAVCAAGDGVGVVGPGRRARRPPRLARSCR